MVLLLVFSGQPVRMSFVRLTSEMTLNKSRKTKLTIGHSER